jgi:uncharacterized membrane protein
VPAEAEQDDLLLPLLSSLDRLFDRRGDGVARLGGQSPNRTIMLILSYLGILALIPLLVEKEDAEVQWHAKHGIVLLAAWIVVWIALIIVGMVPVVGTAIGCLLSVVLPLGILVVHIICIVKALNGDKFRLPMISDFADQWK